MKPHSNNIHAKLLMSLIVIFILVSISGCIPECKKIYETSKSGIKYQCITCCKENTETKIGSQETYFIVKHKDIARQMKLNGYADDLTLDFNKREAVLFKDIYPRISNDPDGNGYEFVVLDLDSLDIKYTWKIDSKNCDIEFIHHPYLKLNDDGNMLTAFYDLDCKVNTDCTTIMTNTNVGHVTVCPPKQIVTVWDKENGLLINEIVIPDPSLPDSCTPILGVTDLSFSPDNKYIALYGIYSIQRDKSKITFLDYYFPKLKGCLFVFSIEDGRLLLTNSSVYRPEFPLWPKDQSKIPELSWESIGDKYKIKFPNNSYLEFNPD